MCIKYNKAPLPFQGQKRNFVKLVRQLDFSGKTVVDLFGGSGLLSHTIKRHNPSARVIYNDFDNYQGRLNQIEQTELLRQQLQACTAHLTKDEKVGEPDKVRLLEVIKASGCTDFLTVSSWLLFGGKYAHSLDELSKAGWYAQVPSSMLFAESYLEGVERVRDDFRAIIKRFYGQDDVIYVADPPYIMTNQTGYSGKNDKFFKLKDVIDLVKGIYQNQALFFSSPKSETEALFEVWQPESIRKTQLNSWIAFNAKAVDYLFLLNCPSEFFISENCKGVAVGAKDL